MYFNKTFQNIDDYEKCSDEKLLPKDLKIGKLYKFNCGTERYLIATDRNEKDPIYVFGNNELNFQIESNLKNISKELENKIDEKQRKILLSCYLLRKDRNGSKLHSLKELIPIIDKNGNILDKDYFSVDFCNFDCFIYDKVNEGKLKYILISYMINNNVSYEFYQNEIKNIRIKNNKIIFDYGYDNFNSNEFLPIKKDIIFESELFVYQVKTENLPKNVKI